MKTELHIHTRYSHDSVLCISLIGLMCRVRQIDCVAVCDHNTVSGGIESQKILSRFGVSVIAGEEIFTESGEIIGLFLEKSIPAGLSAEETVREIKKQGGLVYVPHPYDEKRHRTVLKKEALMSIAEDADLIEIYNGRNIKSEFSEKQRCIADKYTDNEKTARVCGSDSHTFLEIGRNYMISEGFDADDPVQFKKAMKKAELHTAPCLRTAHAKTRAARMIKMMLKGDLGGIYRIFKKKCLRRGDTSR